MEFLAINDILNQNQFGFRSKHSTTLAIVELTDTIYRNLDNKQNAVDTYLYLSKAFDTVDHDILLSKLYNYGIRGISLDWFRSYLKNRNQYTIVNDYKSLPRKITYGVPQGSVLGPLLFLLYINDINFAVKDGTLKLYADDTNLFLSDNDLNKLCTRTNRSLASLHEWFLANKLSINFEKRFIAYLHPTKHKK